MSLGTKKCAAFRWKTGPELPRCWPFSVEAREVVADLPRASAFYDKVLAPMGITRSLKFEPKNGPAGDLVEYGYNKDNRHFFWISEGDVDPRGVDIGFAAKDKEQVDAC
ncbi:hypothetical protein F5883DRAFT_713531 [Diaporthe sp. PMI_573]|nr:hypothetical protein F5883DRAFT_713531 [Diaporthaceae sp. PMI_573]